MTEQEFLNKIEGTVNDLENRLITRQEAMNYLLQLYIDVLKPVAGLKESLASLTYNSWKMRHLQTRFFSGDKSVVSDAKRYERKVDDLMITVMKHPGFSIQDLIKKFEPQKLF